MISFQMFKGILSRNSGSLLFGLFMVSLIIAVKHLIISELKPPSDIYSLSNDQVGDSLGHKGLNLLQIMIPNVNLSKQEEQDIGDGFLCTIMSFKQRNNGIIISGTMRNPTCNTVNTWSQDYYYNSNFVITFRIPNRSNNGEMTELTHRFFIPGLMNQLEGKPFTVFVPGVEKVFAEHVKMKYFDLTIEKSGAPKLKF